MPDVKDLVKKQAARDRASRVTTFRAYRLKVVKLSSMSIGVETGETETCIDQRTGWENERPRLVFLPRSRVAVMPGSMLREGQEAVIDVPGWLAREKGLRDEDLVR